MVVMGVGERRMGGKVVGKDSVACLCWCCLCEEETPVLALVSVSAVLPFSVQAIRDHVERYNEEEEERRKKGEEEEEALL